MKTSWTKGIKDKEVEQDLRSTFLSARPLLNRLDEMLAEKIKEKQVGQTLKANYDCPNWSMLQADAVGYIRALEEIRKLIEK